MVLPILLLLVAGAAQFGILFATKHELTQIARDAGRWAATQQFVPCDGTEAESALAAYTDELAQQTGLFGYAPGTFLGSALEAEWSVEGASSCPPLDTTEVAWVSIELRHDVPPVVPGFPTMTLTSTAMFRMEAQPEP